MLKQILFGALVSSSAIALAPTLINQENNKITISDSEPSEAQNDIYNEMVFDIMNSLIMAKTTNGESLRQGKNVNVALPLLWNTIDSVKTDAKAQAEVIPGVGQYLVPIIDNIKESDLKFVNPDETLHVGQNVFNLTLTIGSKDFSITMTMTGVSS